MPERRSAGRWSRRRTGTALLVAGVAGALVVGLLGVGGGDGRASGRAGGDSGAGAPAASEPKGQAVPWDGARLAEGEPARLTLYFTGGPPGPPDAPCARSYEATVAPGSHRTTVTLWELPAPPLPPGHGCALIGYARSLTVELPAPPRGRPVVDGATGEARFVSDAARLLGPTWLPPGYRPAGERVELGIDARDWAPPWPDERLSIEQGDPGKLARPGRDPVVLATPVVRGTRATVWKTRNFDDSICVSWSEAATGHRVCTTGTPEQLLPVDQLVRVATGLRG